MRTIDLVGGEAEFVLSSSGHIQALVNPPTNPRAAFRTGPTGDVDDPESWRAAAELHSGSWWEHWRDWLADRSGSLVDASDELGSANHPPSDLAPGRYVHDL